MPPIFVTDYAWKQNEFEVHITIPLRNVHSSKVHLFTTDTFVKVNSPPYIFQLVLEHPIIRTKTRCIVRQNEVILELVKAAPGIWDSLYKTVHKNDLVDLKQQIISREHDRAAVETKKVEKDKRESKKRLHTYQMAINKEEKERIQSHKDGVKATALQELVHFKNNVTSTENNPMNILPVPVPLPRTTGEIKFSFTARVLPTPKRESTAKEEEEWLKKEAEAWRATGFVPDELAEDEKDPTFILAKGIKFFENENYVGAINAFAFGVTLAPKIPVFYLQLAKAHLKLDHYYKAVENATKALELLTPVVEKNKSMRVEAYKIRAETYRQINEHELSAADLRLADLTEKTPISSS